ncbi:MAG TPA: lasso peptide biosynthesis B2 protein [Longimicrobiales bacterium]
MSARKSTMPSVAGCAAALVLVKVFLKVAGFGRTYAAFSRLVRRRGSEAVTPAVLRDAVGRVALVAAFFPGRALCLEQSLTLWLLLRQRGIDAELRLGVQPYPFGAHAWVEHRGEPINENPEFVRTFTALPSFAR